VPPVLRALACAMAVVRHHQQWAGEPEASGLAAPAVQSASATQPATTQQATTLQNHQAG